MAQMRGEKERRRERETEGKRDGGKERRRERETELLVINSSEGSWSVTVVTCCDDGIDHFPVD